MLDLFWPLPYLFSLKVCHLLEKSKELRLMQREYLCGFSSSGKRNQGLCKLLMQICHNLKSALHSWQVLTWSLSSSFKYWKLSGNGWNFFHLRTGIVFHNPGGKGVVVRGFILFVFFLCLKNHIFAHLHHKGGGTVLGTVS